MYQNDSHKTLQAKLRKIETSRNTKVQLEQLEKGMLSKKTNYNTLVFKRAKKQAELHDLHSNLNNLSMDSNETFQLK